MSDLLARWVPIADRLPEERGLYFVRAESADSQKPLFCTAWYENGWSLMIAVFIPSITHWMKPALNESGEASGS